MAQNKLSQRLYDTYPQFKEKEIVNKRFSHQQMMDVLQKYDSSNIIEIQIAGHSIEGREIKLVRIGKGSINVFAWSQMHGDESTATMALLDILKFFTSDNNEFEEYRNLINENISFYFIPMLNPDGTENFTRRNELDIDLNRDAKRLQFPESKILKSAQDSIKPIFSFNLHDQSTRYTVGDSYKVATISFLTPTFNYEKDINDVRINSMKLISLLKKELDHFIPGHIAKYSDDFEPRAFGDNFVKWGSSLILIESGGWKNNYEKQFLRKINFIAMLSGLNSIASKSYSKESIDVYNAIPENQKKLFDLLLKNVTVSKNGYEYIVDIGINQNEIGSSDNRDFYFDGSIEDIGDLSTFYGFDEFECKGLKLEKAKIFPNSFKNISKLKKSDLTKILSQGYSFVHVDTIEATENYTPLPINILNKNSENIEEFGLNRSANFILTKNEKIIFVCVNGFLYDLRSQKNYIKNGKIFR
ncbi:MAG: M14 family zinc carboxypeptidase [Bacteroidota bacterium]